MLNNLIRFFHRPPDFIIGDKGHPYLKRWWVIPRNRRLNIYLHQFLRDDEDRALHDHPWASLSIILWSGYIEHLQNGKTVNRRAGQLVLRKPSTAHRVELYRDRSRLTPRPIPAWTLFITGPRVREWGFLCPQGWRHWREFTSPSDYGQVGRGCD
jgi:hypothetical protein